MKKEAAASGWCRRCRRWHSLDHGDSLVQARRLIECLRQMGTLAGDGAMDARLATDYLFAADGGKMFGVLVAADSQGREVTLQAFSGQYNGLFAVPGWSPPLFPAEEYQRLAAEADVRIKSLEAQITSLTASDSRRASLAEERRALSRALMPRLHGLYQLQNMRGETASIFDAWARPGGIPTGAGDCCAPKLLCQAARQGLTPLGICEFFFGDGGQGIEARRHLGIYAACAAKCQPLLGFLLCGLDAAKARP
ncbi:MAG: hypothetical protein LBH14_05695 [Desulfobulbaceae bacterium]|jgi:hypothetical protein|nr:hypothetical protein [Desulfobulbaceae bacterium]